MDELKDKLIHSVIDQIHEDFGTGELMPLVELLHAVPVKSLIAFLSDANAHGQVPHFDQGVNNIAK